jgi:MATE family multidrug resistance protein
MTELAIANPSHPWWTEVRATLALGWPLVLTNLAQMSIGTTDVVMMGWLGPDALAAGAIGSNAYFTLWIFCFGVVMATQPMVAQAIGRQRRIVRDVRRSLRQGAWMGVALGVPSCVALWNVEPIFFALGQDPSLIPEAVAYVRAYLLGLIPALWFGILRGFLAAFDRPRVGLWIMLAGVVVNALGNYALIFGHWGFPAMGLPGSGYASSLANAFMFAALLGFVLVDRRFRRFRLLGRWWRPDWPRFAELLHLGLPIGGIWLLEVGVFAAAVFVMGVISANTVAAHMIAIQCAALAFMVPLGLGQAATVRVGIAAGAGDAIGVRRAGWCALALGVGFMAMTALVMVIAPHTIVGWFLYLDRPETAEVAELAAAFLAVAALFQMVDGAQAVAAGALRGLKDTRVPMAVAAIGYWLIGGPIGIGLAFGAGWQGVGIWVGLASGLAVVAVLLVWRFASRCHNASPASA